MPNWLQKILPPAPPQNQKRNNLPADLQQRPVMMQGRRPQQPGGLPNASLIYGIAASVLGVVGLYLMLFGHKPFGGLLTILLAICFLGFALHFIKYPQA
jgi:hypothetical protein